MPITFEELFEKALNNNITILSDVGDELSFDYNPEQDIIGEVYFSSSNIGNSIDNEKHHQYSFISDLSTKRYGVPEKGVDYEYYDKEKTKLKRSSAIQVSQFKIEGNKVFLEDVKSYGFSKSYYENGKLKSFVHYTNGMLDGLYVFFREDGTLCSKGNYLAGMKHGKQFLYDVYGKLFAVDCYSYGVQD